MRSFKKSLACAIIASMLLAGTALAAKTYQVTGPVLEVSESIIAVQKGKDRWELNRDSNTKMGAAVKAALRAFLTAPSP